MAEASALKQGAFGGYFWLGVQSGGLEQEGSCRCEEKQQHSRPGFEANSPGACGARGNRAAKDDS